MRRWVRRVAGVPALVGMLVVVLVAALGGCSTGEDDSYVPPSAPPTSEPSIDLPRAKAAAGIADCPASGQQPARTGGLPDITLACLGGGRPVRLAGLRGRPMLINVWAQWCGPCRGEAPLLAEVARRSAAASDTAASQRLLVLGIDYADPQPGYAIEFAQYAGWRYPQLQDQEQAIRAQLPFPGPPQTYLVDPDGRIVYHHSGAFSSTAQVLAAVHDHLGVRL